MYSPPPFTILYGFVYRAFSNFITACESLVLQCCLCPPLRFCKPNLCFSVHLFRCLSVCTSCFSVYILPFPVHMSIHRILWSTFYHSPFTCLYIGVLCLPFTILPAHVCTSWFYVYLLPFSPQMSVHLGFMSPFYHSPCTGLYIVFFCLPFTILCTHVCISCFLSIPVTTLRSQVCTW